MNAPSTPVADLDRFALLANRSLHQALERFIRTKVPASEVQDIVQSTLADALASKGMPSTEEEAWRWVHGIARHKIADHYRRAARERAPDSKDVSEIPAASAPLSARDLLRWAERELPQGDVAENTLDWMLREGQGEKLEHIAEEQNEAAPRVRQRVSRMRRFFRERWARQLAAVAGFTLLVMAGWWLTRSLVERQPRIVRDVPSAIPPVAERVVEIRRRGIADCEAERWKQCIERLDEAKVLDPAGDAQPEVQGARRRAERALRERREPRTSPDASTPTPDASARAPRSPAPSVTSIPPPTKANSKVGSDGPDSPFGK